MTYDYSLVTNVTGILMAPNEMLNGWFWFGMVLMLFIVMVMALLQYGPELATIASSFVGLAGSLLLHYAGLVSWWGVLFFLGWFILIAMYVYVTSARANQ